MAVGYRRRLLFGSRVKGAPAMWQQGTGGGYYMEVGYKRRLLCWQQGTQGGCYVGTMCRRRQLCGTRV